MNDEALRRNVRLKSKIINDNISVDEVKEELRKMEEKFGDDAFLPYTLKKKSKPWDKAYLDDLESLSIAGASSKEFILHMAEVKEDILEQKRRIRNLIIGCVVVAVAVIGFIVWLCRR